MSGPKVLRGGRPVVRWVSDCVRTRAAIRQPAFRNRVLAGHPLCQRDAFHRACRVRDGRYGTSNNQAQGLTSNRRKERLPTRSRQEFRQRQLARLGRHADPAFEFAIRVEHVVCTMTDVGDHHPAHPARVFSGSFPR